MKCTWTWAAALLMVACTSNSVSIPPPDPSRPRGGDGGFFQGFDVPQFFDPDGGSFPTGPDGGPGPCGGITGNLCPDGASCTFSGDCNVGSICNIADDAFFDPAFPQDTCRRLVCASDGECPAGQHCGLTRMCQPTVCQHSGECAAGQQCRAGVCGAPSVLPPSASCRVATSDVVLRVPGRVALEALVQEAGGALVAEVPLVWQSSAPGVVRVVDQEAVAVGPPGAAELSARLPSGVVCAGVVRAQVLGELPGDEIRVVVVDARDGRALAGATVSVVRGAAVQEAQTDASGQVVLPGGSEPVASVTVQAAGRETLSVIEPGGRDLLLPLELAPDPVARGGIRGGVDLSTLPRGDFRIGLVSAALPADLSRFRLSNLFGEILPTPINAPQLGLMNTELMLPGGAMLGLGNERFTDDLASTNVRCQGSLVGGQRLGCFVTQLPAGPSLGWVVAARLKLQDVASVAGRIASAGGLGGPPLDLALLMMPLMRGAPLGLTPPLDITAVPRVDVDTGLPSARCSDPATPAGSSHCRGDFARYAEVSMAATAKPQLQSVISLPVLPATRDGRASEGVVLLAAASMPQRGWLPLGIDGVRTEAQGTSGLTDRVEKPFGQFSDTLEPGQVPLQSALAHSGLEGRPKVVVAVAYDQGPRDAEGRSLADTGARYSGLVTPVIRVERELNLRGRAFVRYAGGTFDRMRGVYTGNIPGDVSLVRLELSDGARGWRIYAPPGRSTLTLPPLAGPRQVLMGTPRLSVQLVRGRFVYRELLRGGSGEGLRELPSLTEAFSAETCGRGPQAGCVTN